MEKKPKAKVIGKDENVFNLIAICSSALNKAGMKEKSTEMCSKIYKSKSYDEALSIMGEYCELY